MLIRNVNFYFRIKYYINTNIFIFFSAYNSKKSFQSHFQYCTKRLDFKCRLCSNDINIKYQSSDEIMMHYSIEHMLYVCPWCHKEFDQKYVSFFAVIFLLLLNFIFSAELVAHIDEHNKVIIDGKEMWRCDTCTKTFEILPEFHVHKMSHFKPFICPRCRYSFAVLSSLRRHCQLTHKFEIKLFNSFECSYCGHKLSSKSDLKVHMFREHFPSLNSTYICDDFESLNILDSHRLLHTVEPTDYVPIQR